MTRNLRAETSRPSFSSRESNFDSSASFRPMSFTCVDNSPNCDGCNDNNGSYDAGDHLFDHSCEVLDFIVKSPVESVKSFGILCACLPVIQC